MKYTAYISYNSKDDRWAKWLQRKLEAYNIPVVIRNEKDEVVKRLDKPQKMRVFRYRADLNTVSLSEGLAKELDDARWLIVICSPNSAQSTWVGKEIQHFLDIGRRDHILPFIVSGTSYSDNENECLNPALKAAFPDGDILGVNINDYGDAPRLYRERKALVRTVSLLIEVPEAYGYLWNRYRMRFWQSVALKVAGTVTIVTLLLWAFHYNTEFDSQIRLNDTTPDNPYLPIPDSLKLILTLDNEEKTLVLNETDETGIYKNLPGRFASQEVQLIFKADGYESVDTVVTLQRNGEVNLNIHRDDTYGVLAGTIIDEKGQPVGGATVEAEGVTCTSEEDGSFKLIIPIEKQKPCPHVHISKVGYQTEEYTHQGVGRNWQVMLQK
jgi:hypothetical protein